MKMNCLSQKMTALLMGGSLLAATYAVVLTVHASDQVSKAKSIGLVVDNRPLEHDVKLATSFAPIVKKVVPSVVKVEVTIAAKEMDAGPDIMMGNPLLRQFFGNQFGGGHRKYMTPTEH